MRCPCSACSRGSSSAATAAPAPRAAPLWGAGVLFAADLTFWHHSIEAVGAGLATVLGNIQVVLVGLLAWVVLGERPETARSPRSPWSSAASS